MVRDNGTPSQRSFARIVINVHDENDHHPEFISPSFESQVYETAALGTSVIRILAVDKDKGKNAQLHFSIASGNDCYFSYFYIQYRTSYPERYFQLIDFRIFLEKSIIVCQFDICIA